MGYMSDLARYAARYRDWGFIPLPVQGYEKFPWHLSISQYSAEDLERLSAETDYSRATGIWLLLHEPPRDDGYVHVAIDLDELPDLRKLPQDARELFYEYAYNTFAYWTARGAHFHFLVPREEIPYTRRFVQIYQGGQHVVDLFIFAPADDPKFSDAWRRGVLVYPSVAKDTHSEGNRRVARRLFGTELKPPMKISWAALQHFLRKVYGDDLSFGVTGRREPKIGEITLSTNTETQATGRVSARVASLLRILHKYACLAEVLPTVNASGVVVAPPFRVVKEGGRNNALMAILSTAVRVAAPLTVDDLVALARVVNRYTLQPPLKDAEVVSVVQSVAGHGYEMKPTTFAERLGLTDKCDSCPLKTLCYGENLLEMEEPVFESIPADAHFPAAYFRGQQQEELYRKLLRAVEDPANKIVLGLAPTGSGKTLHATGLAAMAVRERSVPVVVLVPTKQLQNQHEAWLSRAGVPHVVFKGRGNFMCPLLDALRSYVEREFAGEIIPKDDPDVSWTATGAPCAIGVSCARACSAYKTIEKVKKKEENDELSQEDIDKKADADTVLADFANALEATILTHFDGVSPARAAALANGFLEDVCAFANGCDYMRMWGTIREILAGSPGVIVANQALLFIAQAVSARASSSEKPALMILDEAHKIIDVLFAPFRLRFADDVDPIEQSIPEILEDELQRARAKQESVKRELSFAVKKGKVEKIKELRRALISIQRYLQRLNMFRTIVATDPQAFVVDTTKEGAIYIRVLKNRRSKVLARFLTTMFPNTQFVLLTATGSELLSVADVVIKTDDVIPVKNRQILYLPVARLSRSALKERARKVYREVVAPMILAQYNSLAPHLASAYKVGKVRAVVHEVAKNRAVYLARALAESGHHVILYAGTKKDYQNMDEDAQEDYRALQQMDNVLVLYSLEDAVGRFKNDATYTFLVSVALDTGHDFDEDDIMLQWIVKTPFQPLMDIDYVLIERAEGKDARDKQYVYDALLQLIQMAGRTTRKPNQYSMTIVLDRSLPTLLKKAIQHGFEDDVRAITKRLVVPFQHAGWVKALPPEIQKDITVV